MKLALAALLAAAAPVAPVFLTPAEKAAARTIQEGAIRGHVRFLAHDLLEGRGPATRGDRLAQEYIATQMQVIGLEPGAPDGSYFQEFDIVGVTTTSPEATTLRKGGETVELAQGTEFIAFSGQEKPEVAIQDAELVFVGYGITAPEFQWNDFKDADLRGKVLVVMNNDPAGDPKLFSGNTRLYYGRWTYKYEEAARKGAAGAIVIHTEPSAGYKWQVVQSSWSGEQFAVPSAGQPELDVKAWVTEEAARKIATLAGKDLDTLRAAAETRDFRPVPLGVTWSIALQNEVGRKKTANVIGRLPGRDPALAKEVVLYTAHHDHLGMRETGKPGEDLIFNGALDNASGVAAMLEIAQAMKALKPGPRRSVTFAAVGAEEQGLLGALYLAAHPPVPPGRLAANLNMDSMNIWGRTKDVVMVGKGKSSLDTVVAAVAAAQGGRVVLPDQSPDKGFFYRSDQFAFAKVGVPAVYLDAGMDFVGKEAGWGRAQHQEHEAKHYHQPSDELRTEWNLAGAVEDSQLLFYVGVKVANGARMPAWNPGDEFEAARKKALAEVR